MKQRNKCPVCGKGIGQRKTHIEEQVLPASKKPNWPPTNENILGTATAPRGWVGGADDSEKLIAHFRTLWDGESFYAGPRAPFCGNPCALKLARAAHKAGFKL